MPREYWKPERTYDYTAEVAHREDLKERLTRYGLSQTWLLRQLEKEGMRTSKTELSAALNGGRHGMKIDVMLNKIDLILERYESYNENT